MICPDKFKECLPAARVADHIQRGISKVVSGNEFKIVPLADGGEGTVEALVDATRGRIEEVLVHDPLMRPVESFIGISGNGRTAFIEMAAASGLALLKPAERNPLVTTTYGTGELIKFALDKGCTKIILGIGGSATVDGGVGMAQALGVSFTDVEGNDIGPGGGNLGNISKISMSERDPRLNICTIYAACDVTNVLCGPEGAAYVYGPQKGAAHTAIKMLDNNLLHLSDVIRKELKVDAGTIAGSGAAGGLGAGIVAFLNGKLKPGFKLISRTVGLDKKIDWADLVITGEGKMDSQTAFGKTPAGVAQLAAKKHKPVIAFTGAIEENLQNFHSNGFKAVIPIADRPMSLEESLVNAGRLLEASAERVAIMMCLGRELLG